LNSTRGNGLEGSAFFTYESSFILAAMSEFVRRNRVDLMERFAWEDNSWAKNEALAAK